MSLISSMLLVQVFVIFYKLLVYRGFNVAVIHARHLGFQ